jgi:hypothetical protein
MARFGTRARSLAQGHDIQGVCERWDERVVIDEQGPETGEWIRELWEKWFDVLVFLEMLSRLISGTR